MNHLFQMADLFGSFLADGELGNRFRATEVESALSLGKQVIFDFQGVTNMTDSFANGVFANLAADHPTELASRFEFRNCSPLVRSIVGAALARGLRESEQIARRS
jgi:hypothetical protein